MVHATNTLRVMEKTLQVPKTNHVNVRVPKELAGITSLRITKTPERKLLEAFLRAVERR